MPLWLLYTTVQKLSNAGIVDPTNTFLVRITSGDEQRAKTGGLKKWLTQIHWDTIQLHVSAIANTVVQFCTPASRMART